jgi:DNA-binding MarR family transcriptional regulator
VAARLTEAAAGLSAAQLFVLSVVADAEESSMSQLAERTMTDRSSVAAVVDRLAERGLVLRRQSAGDRRRAAISITAAGRRALRAAPLAPTELLVSGLRSLAPDELRDLAAGLEALTRTLGIGGGPAGMLFEEDAPPAAPGAIRPAKPARPK